MKKMVKAAAFAAMLLAAGFAACQKDGAAKASATVSAKDAEKAAGHLIMDGTTVLGYTDGLPAKLVIPAGVTAIGEEAFKSCESITSVVIPEGVTSIGKYAFGSCSSLKSVTIPGSVTDIGEKAFSYCKSLTSVTIPDGVTSIGTNAFSRTSLKSVTIPASVTEIREYAFKDCSSLTSVKIPDGVTEIGWRAFMDCKSLTDVTVPASLTFVGVNAFEDCFSLKEVKYAGTKAQWNEIKTNGIFYVSGKPSFDKADAVTGEKKIGNVVVTCTDGAIKSSIVYY